MSKKVAYKCPKCGWNKLGLLKFKYGGSFDIAMCGDYDFECGKCNHKFKKEEGLRN